MKNDLTDPYGISCMLWRYVRDPDKVEWMQKCVDGLVCDGVLRLPFMCRSE
jgi:hypothetical protein